MDLKIFCITAKRLYVLEKLPSYITPFGLGNSEYPNNWLSEKTGENISHLNKFYGELSGMYWLWKNYINKINDYKWIGFCQYRRLWLNELYNSKQKLNPSSLYQIYLNLIIIFFRQQKQYYYNQRLLLVKILENNFDTLYGKNILNECLEFVDNKNKDDFKKYLEGNKMSICNMFITKPQIFNSYCGDMFNWIDKCFNYCNKRFVKEWKY